MEKINLSKYGHAQSPFRRELIQVKENKYRAEGVQRLIGDLINLEAIDFDGGPYLGKGTMLGDKEIKMITLEGTDVMLYVGIPSKNPSRT